MFFKQTYNYSIDPIKEQITLSLTKNTIIGLAALTVGPLVVLPVIGFVMEKMDERKARLEKLDTSSDTE